MVDYYNHVKHCTTHPKFLHSNSTSHRWVFGAIAELIDNAIDPDVNASQFCIDMKEFNGEPCLVFMDNGSGLVPEKLHKMLSFGHSKKQMTPGDRSIGKHGNGFKSGTMRLGKDVLVLTKCADSMTAGFLSQTFLADTAAEDILIPQVSWDRQGNRLSPVDLEIEESLRAICKYSIFPDEESLLAQLEAIPQTGAILIISNLRRHEGVLELDFETDPHDIRITSEITSTPHFQQLRPNQPNTTVVPMDYSLRAYVSILYKVPRMQIFIRDKKVKTKRIAGLLSQKETETYKPYGVAESIKIELGFNTENKNLYGMMLYHRNRLIKAYMRVGMQLEENERGMGVIGLAEADFLQPTHNKQDFDDTTAYRRLLKKLSDVLAEYWWEKKERANVLQIQPETRRRGPAGAHSEDVPDTNWVQCDNPTCLKWRVLPPGTAVEKLPDIWYCEYHPDPKYRRHEEPEQEWDTTVQHEIIERRRERKREYDRERKEREAEKKRQRLEAATRDSVAVLEKQREELAKGIEEQLERERQALEEQKRREEEVKKLNEEWALIKEDCARMESKREEMLKEQKELENQLAAAQQDLARKAREKEEFALLQAQKEAEKEEFALLQAQKEAEKAAQMLAEKETGKASSDQQTQGQTRPPEENGHVSESTMDDTVTPSKGRKGGGLKRRKGTSVKEKRGTPIGTALPSTTRLPHFPEANYISQNMEANGIHLADSSRHCPVSPVPPGSFAQRVRQLQASLPPRHGKTAASSSEGPVARVPTGNPQQIQRNGTNSAAGTTQRNGSQGTSAGRSREQGRGASTSQAPLLEWGPPRDLSNPVQLPQSEERMSNGAVPSTESPRVQFSSPGMNGTVQDKSLLITPTSNYQMQAEDSHSSMDQRSTSASDAVHQPTVISDDHMTGSLVSTGQQVTVTTTTDRGNQHSEAPQVDPSVRSGGLQGQPAANASEPGRLCVDLPMDSSVFKSESIRTLDKEFFSSQRRLRLALNTLTRIGGLNDGRVYDLDQLPITDEEVIQICEKTKENVEAKVAKYKQDVASLKAELAYLMADKYQHGQGQSWNFKIQSVINKWGVMEVSKKN